MFHVRAVVTRSMFVPCLLVLIPTRVSRDVLPEPRGPIRRIEGKVIRPLDRKTTEWRKRGIDKMRMTAIASPRGEGLKRASTKSLKVDMSLSFDWRFLEWRICCNKASRELKIARPNSGAKSY